MAGSKKSAALIGDIGEDGWLRLGEEGAVDDLFKYRMEVVLGLALGTCCGAGWPELKAMAFMLHIASQGLGRATIDHALWGDLRRD